MNYKSLKDCLYLNNIDKFDFIIIFSDFFKIMMRNKVASDKFCCELRQNIDYFKKFKTIVLPTFNLDFYKTLKTGEDVKYITTGYLNKYLLRNIEFLRTRKPIGNFSVVGDKAKKILDLKQESFFGKNSVISFLARNQTLGLGIGINPENFAWTTNHVCEEEMKVPYRFYKKFIGHNCDTNEKVEENVFVRNLDMKFVNDETIIPKELFKRNKIQKVQYKDVNLTFTNLNDHYKEGIKILKKNLYGLAKKC